MTTNNDNKVLIEQLEKELNPLEKETSATSLEKAINKNFTEEEIKLNGLANFYGLRESWSILIQICIAVLLLSQLLIIILIGRNVLIYNSTVVISIFFAETFAQIIGLAILVVKFLFKENNT